MNLAPTGVFGVTSNPHGWSDKEGQLSKWTEQFDRMVRWYERFKQTDSGRLHNTESDNYVDEILAFFQNAYHFKDWIRNDPSVPQAVSAAVEPYINASAELSICADLCNATKHLTLTKSRSAANPTLGPKVFSLGLGTGSPATISLKYEVTTNSGPLDAFQLATKCIDAWKTFLSNHGMK